MNQINLHNKKIILLDNSEKGEVSSKTIFEYQQNQNLITADYKGGTIRYGKIIGQLENEKIEMLYQCLTTDGVLMAGKAIADVSISAENKMKLKLNWEWISGKEGKGESEYIEI